MAKADLTPELLSNVANTFSIGADPEFAVLRPPDDTIVENKGEASTHFKLLSGEVGHDHDGRVWELRPRPEMSAYQLTINIWKLLRSEQFSKVLDFKWKAGALGGRRVQFGEGRTFYQDTLGGHIHFGFDTTVLAKKLSVLACGTSKLTALDILPTVESQKRASVRPEYGDLLGFRDCAGHAEYRAPSSWLTRPGQALACLTIYKLLAVNSKFASWTKDSTNLKKHLLDWLSTWSEKDVDAWLLNRFIEKRGFSAIQADPEHDIKSEWRKEELWAR